MNKKILIGIIIVVIVIVAGVYFTKMPAQNTNKKVKLETNFGNITLELYGDMPITTGNFISLVQKGFYNSVIFHRIIDGFMIQGGDPTGTGLGDKSIPMIKDEFNGIQKNNRGTLAMANAGPNTGSSQFFINVADNGNNAIDQAGTKFDAVYAVFGRVISGQNVVNAIANAQVTANPYTGENSMPVQPVTLIKATILS